MSDVVISVEHLGKKYRLQHQAERQRDTALRSALSAGRFAPRRHTTAKT